MFIEKKEYKIIDNLLEEIEKDFELEKKELKEIFINIINNIKSYQEISIDTINEEKLLTIIRTGNKLKIQLEKGTNLNNLKRILEKV